MKSRAKRSASSPLASESAPGGREPSEQSSTKARAQPDRHLVLNEACIAIRKLDSARGVKENEAKKRAQREEGCSVSKPLRRGGNTGYMHQADATSELHYENLTAHEDRGEDVSSYSPRHRRYRRHAHDSNL